MTNRNMVKPNLGPGAPQPNPTPPTVQPAPEGERQAYTTEEPLDSPQPKPMIKQDKNKGLKTG